MTEKFVPEPFIVPASFQGDRFRMEPLGVEHNERDHEAWMGSMDHIASTPGFADWAWPQPMSLEANRSDLQGHADDFANRRGFTYSILDGDDVIGCLYIYPADGDDFDASVRSWVTATRSDMDKIVWRDVSAWLADEWPFENPRYAVRP